MSRTRLLTRLAYRGHVVPWDLRDPDPALVKLLEGPPALPPGRALDIGCGAGPNLICLARHGWDATGVDYVPEAVAEAKRRLARAGVAARAFEDDFTDLQSDAIEGQFDLLLDIGCLQGIPLAKRDAYVRQSARLAREGASFLLFEYGNSRGRLRYTGVPGITSEEVLTRFGDDFELIRTWPGPTVQRWWLLGGWGDWAPAYYLFRRR